MKEERATEQTAYERQMAFQHSSRRRKRLLTLVMVALMGGAFATAVLMSRPIQRLPNEYTPTESGSAAETEDLSSGVEAEDADLTQVEETPEATQEPEIWQQSDDWQLLLVNRWNALPEDYETVETVTLSNGYEVDQRIYPDLQEMFDDMREQDVYPTVASGYRTHQRQIEILNERIEGYLDEGYDVDEATDEALQWVAVPGTSEHETGLAVDINADDDYSSSDEVYTWLAEHSWEYGFILRYPAGKEDITGIDNEAWHFRYVGREYAQEIYESGLCLEEYLGNTDQSNPISYTYNEDQ